MKQLIIAMINFYQTFLSFDSGLLRLFAPAGGSCCHQPTCSEYTKKMVNKYGSFKGLDLGLRRVLACK